jgi:hypothetical protein
MKEQEYYKEVTDKELTERDHALLLNRNAGDILRATMKSQPTDEDKQSMKQNLIGLQVGVLDLAHKMGVDLVPPIKEIMWDRASNNPKKQ